MKTILFLSYASIKHDFFLNDIIYSDNLFNGDLDQRINLHILVLSISSAST